MDAATARARVQGIVSGVTDFADVWMGIRAGLFDAIAGYGDEGVSPEALAKDLDYFEDYVRVWCHRAYAMELLDDAGDGRLRMAEGLDTLLVEGSPLVGQLSVFEVVLEQAREMPRFLSTGAVLSRQEIDEIFRRVRGDDSPSTRSRLATTAEQRIERIYKQLPQVAGALERGARVLEIGCGTGVLLEFLAAEYPEAKFVGIDPDEHSVALGREQVSAQGLDGRIELLALGAEALDYEDEFDLVSLNIVMHELLPDLRTDAVARARQALKPGGLLVSNDFHYPSELADFRQPKHAMALIDQRFEVTLGHRHLTREQLSQMFADVGFGRSEFYEFELEQPGGRTVGTLSSLAFK